MVSRDSGLVISVGFGRFSGFGRFFQGIWSFWDLMGLHGLVRFLQGLEVFQVKGLSQGLGSIFQDLGLGGLGTKGVSDLGCFRIGY